MKSNLIYIIETNSKENSVLKIGITNDIKKRLKALQTGNSEKLILSHIEEIPNYINIMEMENWLHSIFGEKRKNGEWFTDLSVKEVRKKIFNFLLK